MLADSWRSPASHGLSRARIDLVLDLPHLQYTALQIHPLRNCFALTQGLRHAASRYGEAPKKETTETITKHSQSLQ